MTSTEPLPEWARDRLAVLEDQVAEARAKLDSIRHGMAVGLQPEQLSRMALVMKGWPETMVEEKGASLARFILDNDARATRPRPNFRR